MPEQRDGPQQRGVTAQVVARTRRPAPRPFAAQLTLKPPQPDEILTFGRDQAGQHPGLA